MPLLPWIIAGIATLIAVAGQNNAQDQLNKRAAEQRMASHELSQLSLRLDAMEASLVNKLFRAAMSGTPRNNSGSLLLGDN